MKKLLTLRACLALAVIVTVPSLFMGIFMDDYLHLLTVEGKLHIASPFDVFRFADGDPENLAPFIQHGPLPWYSWPSLKLHFFRPLSSALMYLDNVLFGHVWFFYHLHSTLWYVALAAGAALLYRRWLGPAAVLATALFVLDESHMLPVAWWSNRNALVACVPALAGFLAHLRWREEGWKPGLPLSLAGYAVGFLGSESALGIMGYVGAYELLGRRDGFQRRIGAMLPAAALSVAYLTYYKLAGFGVKGSAIYIDPLGDPVAFLTEAPGRLVMLMSSQFLTLPIEAPLAAPQSKLPLIVAGLLVLFVAALLLRAVFHHIPKRQRRALVWLLAGSVLSAMPGLATFPAGRLTVLSSLGACAIVAVVLQHAWHARAHWPSRVLAVVLVAVHVALPAAGWLFGPALLWRLDDRALEALHASDFANGDITSVNQIAINPPDPFMAMYPLIVRRFEGTPEPKGWHFLSMAPFAHRVTRTDARTLELEFVDGEMLTSLFEQLVRSPKHPYLPGDVVQFDAFQVEVLAVGKQGPRKLRFAFKEPLESPSLQFLEWKDARFSPFTLPAIGESVLLEKTVGLFDPAFVMGSKE